MANINITAFLDKVILGMKQNGANQAELVNDQPMRLYQYGFLRKSGATIPMAQLRSIVAEIDSNFPTQQTGKGRILHYQSASGLYDISITETKTRLTVKITPALVKTSMAHADEDVRSMMAPAPRSKPSGTATVPPTSLLTGTSIAQSADSSNAWKDQQPVAAATLPKVASTQNKGSFGLTAWRMFSVFMGLMWLLRSCGNSNPTPQYSSDPPQTYDPPAQQYNPPTREAVSSSDYMDRQVLNAAMGCIRQYHPDATFPPVQEAMQGVSRVSENKWSVGIQAYFLNQNNQPSEEPYSFYVYYSPDKHTLTVLTLEEDMKANNGN